MFLVAYTNDIFEHHAITTSCYEPCKAQGAFLVFPTWNEMVFPYENYLFWLVLHYIGNVAIAREK